MSDYHILEGRPDGNNYQIAFHIPVPDEDNAVGVNLRIALVEMQGDATSTVPFIDPTEQTQLSDGELYEHLWNYATHPGMTLVEKRDELDVKFTNFASNIPDEIRKRLAYWGYSRNIA